MIHKIFVDPETELSALKKLYRKRLMTGGAVIRLEEGLAENELKQLFDRFKLGAEENNLQTEVLEQIALHPKCSTDLLEQLQALGLSRIDKHIHSREQLVAG